MPALIQAKRIEVKRDRAARVAREAPGCAAGFPEPPISAAAEEPGAGCVAKRQQIQEPSGGQLLTPWEMAHEYAFLVITAGRRTGSYYKLDGPRSVIGRSRRTQAFVDDPLIEGEHASIRCERMGGSARGEFILRDLDSARGTFLNGQRITSMVVLEDGDALRLGETELVFKRI